MRKASARQHLKQLGFCATCLHRVSDLACGVHYLVIALFIRKNRLADECSSWLEHAEELIERRLLVAQQGHDVVDVDDVYAAVSNTAGKQVFWIGNAKLHVALGKPVAAQGFRLAFLGILDISFRAVDTYGRACSTHLGRELVDAFAAPALHIEHLLACHRHVVDDHLGHARKAPLDLAVVVVSVELRCRGLGARVLQRCIRAMTNASRLRRYRIRGKGLVDGFHRNATGTCHPVGVLRACGHTGNRAVGHRVGSRKGTVVCQLRQLADAISQIGARCVDFQLVVVLVEGLVAIVRDKLRRSLTRGDLGQEHEHLAAVKDIGHKLEGIGHLGICRINERLDLGHLAHVSILQRLEGLCSLACLCKGACRHELAHEAYRQALLADVSRRHRVGAQSLGKRRLALSQAADERVVDACPRGKRLFDLAQHIARVDDGTFYIEHLCALACQRIQKQPHQSDALVKLSRTGTAVDICIWVAIQDTAHLVVGAVLVKERIVDRELVCYIVITQILSDQVAVDGLAHLLVQRDELGKILPTTCCYKGFAAACL